MLVLHMVGKETKRRIGVRCNSSWLQSARCSVSPKSRDSRVVLLSSFDLDSFRMLVKLVFIGIRAPF